MDESIYQFDAKALDGETVSLSQFKGKVVLIVNVASKCGYTPQYEGLEKIYQKYKGRGFVVLGFPSNDFLWQERGSDKEIQSFCKLSYGVTFPMFSKIKVRGRDKAPLYGYLISKKTNPKFGGMIRWNFNKFLIDRNGKVAYRFASSETPEGRAVGNEIEKCLSTAAL